MAPMKPESKHRDPDLSGMLSLDQAAHRLRISRKELRRRLGCQEIAFVQIRGRIRIPRTEVERYEAASRSAD